MQNNYRGVFKWTQRVAPVILVFYSTTYYQSDHCFDELRGVQQEVTCDGDSHSSENAAPSSTLMRTLSTCCFSCAHPTLC